MKTYLIDGNNLIGKIKSLSILQKKDKQSVREKLIFILDRYFFGKKVKVFLFFDGYQNLPLKFSAGKIFYSDSQPADKLIKDQIEASKNRKNLIIISSDNELINFGKACSCEIKTSEEFSGLLNEKYIDEEKVKQDEIKNVEEWKKIFNINNE